jgi:hypothetical protein
MLFAFVAAMKKKLKSNSQRQLGNEHVRKEKEEDRR